MPQNQISAGLISNGDFNQNTEDWEVPYGRLEFTAEDPYNPPGAASAITSDAGGSLGYQASFGQCVDLQEYLADLEERDLNKLLAYSMFLKADSRITQITVHGIFLANTRCRSDHLGSFEVIILESAPDWIEINNEAAVPPGARSLHLFLFAAGEDDTARMYIDQVSLYHPDSK